MANIWNETIMNGIVSGQAFKSKSYKDTYSYNCSWGYGHYDFKLEKFWYTLGWKGVDTLKKEFNITISQDDYTQFIKMKDYEWFAKYKKERKSFVKEYMKELVFYAL